MYEMYCFIAAFTAQILFFSLLGPLRMVGTLRRQITQFVAERTPPINPSAIARVDLRLRRLRLLGLATSVIGLLQLIVMIRYMQRPDWTDDPLDTAVPRYFVIQGLPMLLATVTASGFHAVLKHSLPQEKRKALLQPRGLFDFVPQSAIVLAVLAYLLFVALLAYIERHPFPGFDGLLSNTAAVTLVYAGMAGAIYLTLRTMGSSALHAREDRMRSVRLTVRVCVYTCIITVTSIALILTLQLLALQRWEPTFVTIEILVVGLLTGAALREQTRIPEIPSPATAALTR